MSSRADLLIDWCGHDAVAYACKQWHYSRSIPPPPHNRIGVWEGGQFIGVVLFARGANKNMLSPFGLTQIQGCELVRIALNKHQWPVSRIVSISVAFLRRRCPGLRLVVSYADPEQDHHGGIYQAGNWIYTGQTDDSTSYLAPDGKIWHPRMVSANGRKPVFGQSRATWRYDQCQPIKLAGKHRYLMPLDGAMREEIAPLAKPYPKRVKQATDGHHSSSGGAAPTRALQSVAPHVALDNQP